MAPASALRWAAYAGPDWTPTPAQWMQLLELQQEEEKARIKRFHFERDAKTALMGRLMLHAAACVVLGADYSQIKFARSRENKPHLLPVPGFDVEGFNVNLSHHGEWVVLASDHRCLIGCDVMTTTLPRPGETAEQFFQDFETTFSKREWLVIRSPPDESEQLVHFFLNWALKETYLKATGIGLGIDLQRIEFDISTHALNAARLAERTTVPEAATLQIDGKPMEGWHFEIAFLDEKHVMAVGAGPFSQEYGKSPDWPHVAPGREAAMQRDLLEARTIQVQDASQLLPASLRAAYAAAR